MLRLGPILSFRGIVDHRWSVTVLIGISRSQLPPAVSLDGMPCASPRLLHEDSQDAFWRYDLSSSLQDSEQVLKYSIEGLDSYWSFTVPARDQAPRIAYVSCNGFSDANGMRKLVKPQNAVWTDLLCNHQSSLRPDGYTLDREQLWHEANVHDRGVQRFHILAMGGDQIYFDSIWEDIPALKR